MGEPSRTSGIVNTQDPLYELKQLLQHEFPGAELLCNEGQWIVYTLHGVGKTEEEAITNAFAELKRMQSDGRSVRQMLDDVTSDLSSSPGMSKKRHESLTEILSLAGTALNDGILTKTIPWIEQPHYTREITELQRRVDMRLAMTAKELKDAEDARKKAGVKAPKVERNFVPGQGYEQQGTSIQRAFAMLKDRQGK